MGKTEWAKQNGQNRMGKTSSVRSKIFVAPKNKNGKAPSGAI
jgi:hypothetical protein